MKNNKHDKYINEFFSSTPAFPNAIPLPAADSEPTHRLGYDNNDERIHDRVGEDTQHGSKHNPEMDYGQTVNNHYRRGDRVELKNGDYATIEQPIYASSGGLTHYQVHNDQDHKSKRVPVDQIKRTLSLNEDEGFAVQRSNYFDYTEREKSYLENTDWEHRAQLGDFILQNQDKNPHQNIFYNQVELEQMTTTELEHIYQQIQRGLGLKGGYTAKHITYESDHDQHNVHNYIVQNSYVFSPNVRKQYSNVSNLASKDSQEISNLHSNLEMLFDTLRSTLNQTINEYLSEKKIQTREEKISYIVDNSDFDEQFVSLLANRYVDKLYHALEQQHEAKSALNEGKQLNFNHISPEAPDSAAEYLKERGVNIYDFITQALRNDYAFEQVERIVAIYFTGLVNGEIPAEVRDFLHNANQNGDVELNQEVTTTGGMAVPQMPAFAGQGYDKDKAKQVSGWKEALGDKRLAELLFEVQTTANVGAPLLLPTSKDKTESKAPKTRDKAIDYIIKNADKAYQYYDMTWQVSTDTTPITKDKDVLSKLTDSEVFDLASQVSELLQRNQFRKQKQ